jgi:hypothetical protein
MKVKRRVTRRQLAVATAVLALASTWWYVAMYRPSAEGVMHRAVASLDRGDAQQLYRLADPEEIRKLHLTPRTVEQVLKHTVWRVKPIRHIGLKKGRSPKEDSVVWQARYPNADPRFSSVNVASVASREGKWYLNLSFLLRSTCYWSHGAEGPRLYRQLARQYGIDGLREQAGTYVTLTELERRSQPLPQP